MSIDDASSGVEEHADDPRIALWVNDARKGNPTAFGELCRLYWPKLRGIARARLRDDTAEDVVQEVFVKAWSRHETMRKPGFFFAILRTTLADRERAELARERWAAKADEELALILDLGGEVDHKKRLRCLKEAIQALPPERRVLFQARFDGMKYKEMVAMFDKRLRNVERAVKEATDQIAGLVRRCVQRGSYA
ncbi:MAG TPA: sigma-70 family RNA polymerase sigma factor [Thermoanaerobaculia bacterium]|nr:sigma-70 family RNA polymerase sigma factor [Thermoanaerobaculia bacterium]